MASPRSIFGRGTRPRAPERARLVFGEEDGAPRAPRPLFGERGLQAESERRSARRPSPPPEGGTQTDADRVSPSAPLRGAASPSGGGELSARAPAGTVAHAEAPFLPELPGLEGAVPAALPPIEAPAALLAEPAELRALSALQEAQAEAHAARDRYARALAELQRAHALDFRHLEHELSDLAVEIARQILGREIAADRQHVIRLVEAALRVAVDEDAATVLVAPADLALLEAERPRLEVDRGGGLIRLTADPGLHPGECVVQVGRGRIDARMGERLERVRQALHAADSETE